MTLPLIRPTPTVHEDYTADASIVARSGETLPFLKTLPDALFDLIITSVQFGQGRERLKLLEGPRVPWWRRAWYKLTGRQLRGA